MKKLILIILIFSLIVSSIFSFPKLIIPEPPEVQEGDELFVTEADKITYGMLRKALWLDAIFEKVVRYQSEVHSYGEELEAHQRADNRYISKLENTRNVLFGAIACISLVAIIEGVLLNANKK